MTSSRPQKHRNYCFTLNNYNDDDVLRLRQLKDDESVLYIVYGRETGSEGTRHLQGYLRAKNPRSFTWFKGIIGERAHIEPSKGSPAQNRKYCTKDGDFEEYGQIPPGQGTRTDLQSAIDDLRSSGSVKLLADKHPLVYLRYGRNIHAWATLVEAIPKRQWKTLVYVYVGPPGTGKSKRASEEAQAIGDVYYKPNGDWWDGYSGQPCVILDDFYGNLKYNELLNVCDRYPCKVPIKGAFVEFVSTHIYITSNKYVSQWYNREKIPSVQALFRRLTCYLELPANTRPWCETGFDATTCGYDTTIDY